MPIDTDEDIDNRKYNTIEKVNVLLKASLGVPSTDESKPWFSEFQEKFNDGVDGEILFIDPVPEKPSFTNPRGAEDIYMNTTDFEDYDISTSIVDDSTGVVRRFKFLKLEQCKGISKPFISWLKKDTKGDNVLFDTLRFNFKEHIDGGQIVKPYDHFISTNSAYKSEPLPSGESGGNWFIDTKSGILFFPDVDNLNDGIEIFKLSEDNMPVITVYKYIGRKGIGKLLSVKDELESEDKAVKDQIVVLTSDNTIKRFDDINKEWIDIGGGSIINNNGQTFIQLMTEQPGKFTKIDPIITSSGSITINWDFVDIIPKNLNERKLAYGISEKSRCLPYIKEIVVEISDDTDDTDENQKNWVLFKKLEPAANVDYNISPSYKTITLNKTPPDEAGDSDIKKILSRTSLISIRVYGVNNHGNNYPSIEDRALIFTTSFNPGNPPSQPLFKTNGNVVRDSENKHQLSSEFEVSETEKDTLNSEAVLTSYETTFDEKDSLRSIYFTPNSIANPTTSGTLNNITAKTEFNILIGDNNLRAGTNYNYTTTVKNNINANSSISSDEKLSLYTKLPKPSSNPNLIFTENSIKTKVTTKILTDQDIIYLNKNLSKKRSFMPTNVNEQFFEVTDVSATNVTTTGYGKFVDDKDNLAKIEIYIDTSLKETIKYNGFKNNTVQNIIQLGTTYFSTGTIQDMYSNDDNNKGFRLKGTVQLNSILAEDIGIAASDVYKIQYKYTRTFGTPSENSIIHNVYIDNLSTLPIITPINANTCNITSIIHCMGVPSVKNFTIGISRKYTNINSIYGFIPGDGKIATVSSVSGTSWTSESYDLVANDIKISDIYYEKTFEQTNKTYLDVVDGSTILTITEKARSLFGDKTYPDSTAGIPTLSKLTVNHYFDKESFNSDLTSANILDGKTDIKIFEIHDITKLIKLSQLKVRHKIEEPTTITINLTGVEKIDNSAPKAHTLLYLKGEFQTNKKNNYPNTNNYTWDLGESNYNSYESGDYAYDLDGIKDNDNGYKWIVFQIKKTNTNYVKTLNTTQTPYIDLRQLLIDVGMGRISNLNKWSQKFGTEDVIGFVTIKATRKDTDDGLQIGRFSSNKQLNGNTIWYAGQNSNDITLTTLLDVIDGNNYGALLDQQEFIDEFGESTEKWGLECPVQENFKSNNIYIYIGLKNSVSLP